MNRSLLFGALCVLLMSGTGGRAQTISATQTDSFSGNGAGRVTPGNNVTYSIQINNTGGANATGVTLTNPTPANTALVANSLRTTCLAINDSYTALGNVPITIAAGSGVLANDSDIDALGGGTLSATAITGGATTQGGSVTLSTNGGFTYTPPAGFTGADTFSYTLNDNDDVPSTDTATVTITVSGMIWFIDENQASNGDGRLGTPFNNLASFQAINGTGTGNNPKDGQAIFLYESGDDYAGGIVLRAGQRLIGQDATSDLATLAGVTPPTGSAALPAMNSGNGVVARIVNAGGNGVAMGLNSRIHGFTAGNASGNAIQVLSAGTIQVSDVIINTTGPGLLVSATAFGAGASFTSITSTGGSFGISLNNASGTVNLGTGALSGHSGSAFGMGSGSGSATYAGSITKTSGSGFGVTVNSKTGGTVTLSGPISITTASGVTGVNLTNNTGATINLTGGVNLSTGSGSAFTATGGGTVTVTGSNNTLITSTATVLNVSNTTIGAGGLTFRSIDSSGGGSDNGIILSNTGTLGGLTVTGDGTSTVSGGNTTGGTIGSKSGPDGSTTQGTGIYLSNTRNVVLRRMAINGTKENFAIRGDAVVNFTLQYCTVAGTNGNNAGVDEGSVVFTGLTGTALVDGCLISGSVEHNMSVINSSGTLNRITVSGTTFGAMNNTTGSDGLLIEGSGTAVINATVTDNLFTHAIGDHFQYSNNTASQSGDVVFTGNSISNSGVPAVSGGGGIRVIGGSNVGGLNGGVTFNVSNNFMRDSRGTALAVNKLGGSGNWSGSITNNTIGVAGVDGSGSAEGSAIFSLCDGPAGSSYTALISGNTVRQFGNYGIFLQTGGSGVIGGATANWTVTNNVAFNPSTFLFAKNGVHLNGGVVAGDAYQISLNLGGTGAVNTFNGTGTDGGTDFRLRQRQSTTVALPGYAGAATDTAAVVSYVQGRNNAGATGSAAVSSPPGGGFVGGPTTPLPLIFSEGLSIAEAPQAEIGEVTTPAPTAAPFVADPFEVARVPVAIESTDVSPSLSESQLDVLVAEAISRWEATGLSDEQREALRSLRFEVGELDALHLGHAAGDRIEISRSAAGNGWFIDPTPRDDSEFGPATATTRLSARGDGGATDRVDLLTTLMHEMGHRLGLFDRYDESDRDRVIYGFLGKGERRLPAKGEAAGALPWTDAHPRYLGSPLNIGTLPPGKSIIVTFQVTVNSSPTTFTSVSSQGTVSGGNFANVLTNDPDTGAADDATVTPVEQRPTVTNITANGTEDTQLNFTAGQFTGAFNDVNGDNLASIRIASLPLNGTLRANTTPLNVNDEVLAANLGTLNFVPNSNFNGGTMFTYSASDGQDYALLAATVNITIASVNDEPTLTAIPNPTAILEDAAEQTVNLAGISEGAADETGQTLTITATSDNTALIPNPVAVDYTEGNATGAVRYTPAANAFGTAIITVRVQDSGGTAPGDDTIERQFTVVVDPVADTPSITNATTLPNTQTTSGLVVSRNAVDGAEVTHYQVTNIQNGSLFQNNGTTAIAAGSFITHAEASVGLKFTPALNFQGDATFQIQASTSNVVGGLGGNLVTATITVSERVSIDTPNAGDNDATEGGSNNGIFTFTRGGSAGTLVANFVLDPSSTATAADFSLSGGSVTYDGGTGAGTVTFPDGQTTVQVTLTALTEAINASEVAETVRFNLVPVALPAPGAYQAGTPNNATVTIGQNGFLVTTTSDGGPGSLRQAVANANALAGTDTITFSDGTGGTVNFTDAVQDTITLTSGELTLTSDIVVSGTAANRVAVASNGTSRVFQIDPGTTVRLVGLTITNGGGVVHGGGILNRGNVVVLACTISNNTVTGLGASGGGISSGTPAETGSDTTVINSTLSGNSAVLGGGANNHSSNSITLINTTVSGNTATVGAGGGLSSSGSASAFGSTFSGNAAAVGGGGVWSDFSTLALGNSLIAGNTATNGSPDLGRSAVGIITSIGGNLIGNGEDTVNPVTWQVPDLTGTNASPINPLLGPLADNGGATRTHALLSGSPALNAGLLVNVPGDIFDLDGDLDTAELLPVDQRGPGFLRAIGTVDIGAFELQKSVSITALDAAKAEGNGGGTTNFTFTVARTGDLADSVTLDWTVTGSGINAATAADFAAMTGQVTLAATEGSKVVNVVVNAESIVEPAEGFTVTLSNPTNGYVVDGATADGSINNDDSATILLTGGTSKDEGNGGSTTYTFTATLSQPVQGGVSVAYSTNDGTATTADNDYTDNDGSLVFPGSAAGEQRTFDVLVTGDNKVEGNEDFTTSLGLVTGGHGSVSVTGTSQTGTITNDDSATISITDVSQLENAGGMIFSVSLSAPTDIPVTLDFATADNTALAPGDYTATSGSVTFVANSITAQSIPVTILNDGEFEGDETFLVNLTNLVATGRNVSLADGQGQGTIQNDDAQVVSITATDDSADENAPSGGTWRVSRNGSVGAVTANLEVDLTSTATAADWTVSGASFVSREAGGAGTVTIPDGASFVDITLDPVDDPAAEADETVQLNVTAGTGYTASNSPTRTVTIARNDFGVTNVNDSGEGSLRLAVENANFFAGSDVVNFIGATFADAIPDTIVLGGTEITITSPMTIEGIGADRLTIDANGSSKVFAVVIAGDVTIRGLTLTGGRRTSGGDGGALYCDTSTLLLEGCHVTGNSSDSQAGGLGLYNSSIVTIRDCTISENVAEGTTSAVGGILNGGTSLTVHNSTVSNNEASASTTLVAAGGLFSITDLVISNSTITGNSATNGAPAGGVFLGGTAEIRNTIIAGNSAGGVPSDIQAPGATITANFTLIGDAGSAGGITDGTSGNLVGNAGSGTIDIATVLDPVLALRGGSIPVHALVAAGPAVDAGDPAFDGATFTPALTFDQRGAGFPRVVKGLLASAAAILDLGAYELIAAPEFTNPDLRVRADANPVNLAEATGATPPGGTFAGPGVSGGFFNPRNLAPGDYVVTYTVLDAFGVANVSEFTITVEELPSLTLTQPKRFKTTLVGTSSRAQRVYIRNVGGLPATALRVEVSGPAKKDFVVTQPAARSLEAGASTFFQVTFRPRKDGTRKAVVTVYSDTTPASVKVQGRGQSKSGVRPPRAVKK